MLGTSVVGFRIAKDCGKMSWALGGTVGGVVGGNDGDAVKEVVGGNVDGVISLNKGCIDEHTRKAWIFSSCLDMTSRRRSCSFKSFRDISRE